MVVAAPYFSAAPAPMPVPTAIPAHIHRPVARRAPPYIPAPPSSATSSASIFENYPVSVSNMSLILPAPPPTPYESTQFAQYVPATYVTVPAQHLGTPASTPGLVGSDPFGLGRAPSSASSSGSLPPTPGLSPIPLPQTNTGKQLVMEGADLIPPLHYI